ncbi:MAG: MarR family transcriptional regulator [Waltera sp.]
MDATERKMTKIAREVSKFTVQTMKEDGIGTAEFDFIHLVRHNPGITQAAVREQLKIDKGAAARRAASLESKGYLSPEAQLRRMAGASCCMPRRRRSS